MDDVIIGLEVHIQLTALKSKLFCSCPSDFRGKPPNTVVCPVCLGLPGALPVLNDRALDMGIMLALALGCKKIYRKVVFTRKHYFYPDLPKNFQISQHDRYGMTPLAEEGAIVLSNGRVIRIRRIHLEEDPGRLVHVGGPIGSARYELIDYNRSGIALVEIVTEPDIRSPKEAREFLNLLRSIVEHLGISDLSLEGALRCDANVSVKGGTRVEIKNISSFKGVERALTFEINRQRTLLKAGLKIERETRHWDEEREITFGTREKEELADYRYMPEGDLPPVVIAESRINAIRKSMPELPPARIKRFIREYGLSQYLATVLVSDKRMADFFERVIKTGIGKGIKGFATRAANILASDVAGLLSYRGLKIDESKLTPENFAKLIAMEMRSEITVRTAKNLLPEIIDGADPQKLAKERSLLVIRDFESIKQIIDEIIKEHPEAVKDALVNPRAKEFIIGQVMKKTRARADIRLTRMIVDHIVEEEKEKNKDK